MNARSWLCASLILVLLAPLLSPGRPLPQTYDKIRSPVRVTLDYQGTPGPHNTMVLTAHVTTEEPLDNVTLDWVVPPEVTLRGAVSTTLGTLATGQSATAQVEIVLDAAGSYHVAVGAEGTPSVMPSATFGGGDTLYFSVHEDRPSTVSRRAPHVPTEVMIATPNVRYSPTAPDQDGYWIQGCLLYYHRPISSSGPGTPGDIPAKQMLVEIWEDDPVFDDYEGSTRTDSNGCFSFYIPDNDDGWLGGDKETFVRLYPNTPGGYVTDISWLDEEYRYRTENYTGGQNIDIGTIPGGGGSDEYLDRMFHIADVLQDAYTYASQYRGAPDQVKACYEPGYGQDGSNYSPFWNEITIGDAAGDDGYDDTVIIHEYGHFIADRYGCDDSSGGNHYLDRHYDPDLAWSEGWANYLSSAVRDSSWYLDYNWSSSSWYVREDWDAWKTVTGSDNEGAVVATLWDLHDSTTESFDVLAMGGDEIWYTFDELMEEHWYDDLSRDCDVYEFWDQWHKAGYQDDSELAAIFGYHQTAGQGGSRAVEGDAESSLPAADHAQPQVVVQGRLPWNAVLFLVDATNSMAGEIGAVREVIQNKVTEMDALPDPYEYTVETFQDTGANTTVIDHFFPSAVNPAVAAISTGGGGDLPEDSFDALARGTSGRPGYDAWVFTDGPPRQDTTTEAELASLLQLNDVTPYSFIFGDCSGGNLAGAEGKAGPHPLPAGQLHLPRFAPAAMEDCLEPFLLLSADTDGQFFFIDQSQVTDTAEIVRAAMSNNAGAGRYASYVSSGWTYTWDDVPYNWYDASGGTSYNTDNYVAIGFTQAFTYYNSVYQAAYVAAPGYLSFDEISTVVRDNTALPDTALPNNVVYPFWDDISTYVVPLRAGPRDAGPESPLLYSDYDAANNRTVIEWQDAYHRDAMGNHETFEVLLEHSTGAIVMQYATVTDDSSCTVGVENRTGNRATQVAYNNPGALYSGRAIRFTPLPPRPFADYPVMVDSQMNNVFFLLNGYSGDVTVSITRPGGTPVNPGDPGVRYLHVGKVTYYRIQGAEAGQWNAHVAGDGTYYFTAKASSSLQANYQGKPLLPVNLPTPIVVDLGMPVANASFRLVRTNGDPGPSLMLYDDGAHNDRGPNDGCYGGNYTPLEMGTFTIQVDGQLPGGEAFRRVEQVPIRVQGMHVDPAGIGVRFAQPGEVVVHLFPLYNDTGEGRPFHLAVNSSQGWTAVFPQDVFVAANSSILVPVSITVPPDADGLIEQTLLTAQSGEWADNAAMTTAVRGGPATIELDTNPGQVALNGQQAVVMAAVSDAQGWAVADGTVVNFQTTLGTIAPPSAMTVDGLVTVTLTSGATAGTAIVTALAGGASATVAVEMSAVQANTLVLQSSANVLPPDGSATCQLTVHAYDKYGRPAPDGTQIVLSVDGDEMLMGSINSQEGVTVTTAGGVATATYRSGTTGGWAVLWAGLRLEGDEWRLASTRILLSAGGRFDIYLPMVFR